MRCTSGPFPLVSTCPKEKAPPASDVAAVIGGTSVAGMATVNATSGSVAGAGVAGVAKLGCATVAGVAGVADVVAIAMPDEEVGVASAVLFLSCLALPIF